MNFIKGLHESIHWTLETPIKSSDSTLQVTLYFGALRGNFCFASNLSIFVLTKQARLYALWNEAEYSNYYKGVLQGPINPAISMSNRRCISCKRGSERRLGEGRIGDGGGEREDARMPLAG